MMNFTSANMLHIIRFRDRNISKTIKNIFEKRQDFAPLYRNVIIMHGFDISNFAKGWCSAEFTRCNKNARPNRLKNFTFKTHVRYKTGD